MKVYDLEPGDLLQFVPGAGPIPEMISEAQANNHDTWPDPLRLGPHFEWTWEDGLVPRHMVYIGKKRKMGTVIYEVLWNKKPRAIKGKYIRHLERVAGSEGIQADERASTPPKINSPGALPLEPARR